MHPAVALPAKQPQVTLPRHKVGTVAQRHHMMNLKIRLGKETPAARAAAAAAHIQLVFQAHQLLPAVTPEVILRAPQFHAARRDIHVNAENMESVHHRHFKSKP